MLRVTPTPSGALIALALSVVPLFGQSTKPALPLVLPLVPAEPAWQVMLDSVPAAGGAIDAERIYVPLRAQEPEPSAELGTASSSEGVQARDTPLPLEAVPPLLLAPSLQPARIQAFGRHDGRVVWTQPIEAVIAPSAAGDGLYVSSSGELHALEASTGTERWRVSFTAYDKIPVLAVENLLIGASDASTLVALSVGDGSVRWRQMLPSPVARAAVADAERAFVALADGTVMAVALADGAVRWQRRLTAPLAQPAVAANRLVVGANSNMVFALDTGSGDIAWRWRVGGDVVGAAGDDRTIVFAGLDNMLRAVNRDNGNQRWKKPIASRPANQPLLVGGAVVVTSASPIVSVFNAFNGVQLGTYVAPAELEGPVLVGPAGPLDGVAMAVLTRDGRLIGLKPKLPEPAPVGAGGRGRAGGPR